MDSFQCLLLFLFEKKEKNPLGNKAFLREINIENTKMIDIVT